MTTLDLAGAVAAGIVTLGIPLIALVRFIVTRLWKRVDKLEGRLDDCEKRHDDCQDKLEALKLVTFRSLGVGDDTGKILFEEARTSLASKRPSPPPPRRRDV